MSTREDEYIPDDTDNATRVETITDDKYTIDEAIEYIGFGRAQIKLSFMAGVVWMADAMELTILSIISPEVRCMWKLSSWQEAFITTIVFIGMGASSSWWGNVCDQHGRRVGLLLTAIWTTYFGFLSGLAPNYTWLLILRCLTGFGIGGAPQSVTLYSEFLPVASRARCIMAVEVFWAVGTCLEVFLALIIMPTLGFRALLIISAFPLLIVVLAAKWMPESARFNLARGRVDLAQKTLEEVAKDNGKRLPAGGLKPLPQVAQVSSPGDGSKGGLSELFTPGLKRTTMLLWLIWFQCAFAYYGLVLLSTSLFQEQQQTDSVDDGIGGTCPAEFEEDCDLSCKTLDQKDYIDLMWVTLSEFPGLLLTALILEVAGRKFTMATTFFGFGAFSILIIFSTRNTLTWFLFGARALISGGFQATYVYTPEVYPTSVRAIALGSCSGFSRLGALITPFVAQVLLEYDKTIAILVYSLLAILAGICALLLPIETRGRKMNEGADEGVEMQ